MRRTSIFALTALVLSFATLRSQASAVVYLGPPDLALTARVIAAGDDAGTFHSQTLFERAYAAGWPTERAKIEQRFGARALRDCFALLDYAIADSIRIVHRDNVPIPAPTEGAKPLAAELWEAGQTPAGRYDVGYMLERLITHTYHHEIMVDLDSHFTPPANASFHIVLANLIEDANPSH